MNILGICFEYFHDPAAALVQDGQVVAAAEEERFVRIKHSVGFPFPARAIQFCLDRAGIDFTDLDYVGFNFKPWLMFRRRLIVSLKTMLASPSSFKYAAYSAIRPIGVLLELFRNKIELQQSTGKNCRILFNEHHACHAASAFFVSPFEEAAILTIDNRGEDVSSTMAVGRGNQITRIKEIRNPHSLGAFYQGLTRYLGYGPGDEYIVMGLSSHGQPRFAEILREAVYPTKDGGFRFDRSCFEFADQGYISDKVKQVIGPTRAKHEPIEERHADIAASLQLVTEEITLHLCKYVHDVTGLSTLCLAGGVALNSVMNGRLHRESPFKEIFVQPAANDAGASLGSALHIYHGLLHQERASAMQHTLLGPEFSDEEIREALDISKFRYERHDNVAEAAAKLIAEGNVIGWFQGRMEWGPRALGSRSIVADPRRAEMRDHINEYIKFREEFRPLAPSVLEERASEYFECRGSYPFMVVVLPVREDKRSVIPAVTHVDGSARIHTVSRDIDGRYYSLIEEFAKLTGVPVVLNTSFNLRDEPIVMTPRDAIRCFAASGLDYLVVGDYIVRKREP